MTLDSYGNQHGTRHAHGHRDLHGRDHGGRYLHLDYVFRHLDCHVHHVSSRSGPHYITATYSGDDNFGASTSNPLTEVVSKANTTTKLVRQSKSVVPWSAGHSYGCDQRHCPRLWHAHGHVTFCDGTKVLGTAKLMTVKGVATATFTTTIPEAANQVITAVYSGDGNFEASKSGAVTGVVAKATGAMADNTALLVGRSDAAADLNDVDVSLYDLMSDTLTTDVGRKISVADVDMVFATY